MDQLPTGTGHQRVRPRDKRLPRHLDEMKSAREKSASDVDESLEYLWETVFSDSSSGDQQDDSIETNRFDRSSLTNENRNRNERLIMQRRKRRDLHATTDRAADISIWYEARAYRLFIGRACRPIGFFSSTFERQKSNKRVTWTSRNQRDFVWKRLTKESWCDCLTTVGQSACAVISHASVCICPCH